MSSTVGAVPYSRITHQVQLATLGLNGVSQAGDEHWVGRQVVLGQCPASLMSIRLACLNFSGELLIDVRLFGEGRVVLVMMSHMAQRT